MRAARIIVAATVSIVLLAFPALGVATTTETVTIPGNFFSPQTARVYVGDTVRWFNETGRNHTVTSSSDSSESFRSSGSCGLLAGNTCVRPGRSFSHTFDSRGTFTYYCEIHGSDSPFPNCGMCGRIVVVRRKAAATQSASPTTPVSVSPSVSASPPPSGTASVSPSGSSTASPTNSPDLGDEGGSTNIWTIAAVGLVLLGGAGVLVYRTMIRS